MTSDNLKEFTLDSGVRLRLRPPSNFALRQRQDQYNQDQPQPPMVFNPDKEREEPNLNDPDYIYAIEMYEARRVEMVTDVLMATGVTILEIPDGMDGPESEWFTDLLVAIDIPLSPSKTGRQGQWLKYFAATELELNRLNRRLLELCGTAEQEVQAALEDLKSLQERRASGRVSNNGAG